MTTMTSTQAAQHGTQRLSASVCVSVCVQALRMCQLTAAALTVHMLYAVTRCRGAAEQPQKKKKKLYKLLQEQQRQHVR